jgi:hypothetical protein
MNKNKTNKIITILILALAVLTIQACDYNRRPTIPNFVSQEHKE